MTSTLTAMDMAIIKKQFASKSAGAIAWLLERPIAEVNAAIKELTTIGYQPYQKAKAQPQPSALSIAKKKAKDLAIKNEKAAKLALKATKYVGSHSAYVKKEPEKYKTRELDMSQKISVRINAKTTIFVNPGADIEKIKKMYQKN